MSQPSEILLLSEALRLDEAGGAPREVLLFPFGEIPTEKGTLKFTPRSAELIQKQWSAKSRQIGFDYEHGLHDPRVAPKDRVAAGWGDLILADDGLRVRNIAWTPDAAKRIGDKEFRYLSPAIRRTADGEIVAVTNCALTNNPATCAAPALLLSELGPDLPDPPAPPPPHLPAKEPLMINVQTTKHKALALQLAQACGVMLSAAQAAAESDDDGLKKIGAEAAGFVPERLSAIRARFPEMDPGQPVMMSAAERDALVKELETARQVLLAAQEITGQKEGLVGALRGLHAQVLLAGEGGEDAARVALLDKMVKLPAEGGTGQIHPTDRERFETLSLADLQGYHATAPRVGPKGAPAKGARSFDGKPPEEEGTPEQLSADKEMDALFGATPDNPHYKAVVRGR